MKCLLGIDPEKTQKCKPSECASCGWEAEEAARRREYVKRTCKRRFGISTDLFNERAQTAPQERSYSI